MKKKIALGLGALATAVAILPLFAAFEAHVINVTARIENALNVPLEHLDFGTVFPQEKLDKTFDVSLSQSFIDENRVDDVTYVIRQKPKCILVSQNSVDLPQFGLVTEDENGDFHCVDEEHYDILPLLCPYLSKTEITTDSPTGGENDGPKKYPFHGPITVPEWDLQQTLFHQVRGKLIKSGQDFSDTWNIDLKVPCFGGYCAQDWADFVHENSDPLDEVDPDDYIQPIELNHELFGCDLWLEVTGISLPGLGCNEQLDMMLVLDRSSSIDATELQTMKDAANAFVTALAPSAGGVHIGQSSFATSGTLDQHLTDVEADVHTAINALVNGGLTNLFEGIDLANAELDDLHAHERPSVKDVMVVLTDGHPNQPPDSANAEAVAKAEADAARAAGVEIFVVGIGSDVDAAYLQTIADDASHYFAAADFDDLQAILEGLTECNE